MAQYLIFSGRKTSAVPQSGVGIYLFSNYIASADTYYTSGGQHFTINTPNYTNLAGAQQIPTNGEFCGSGQFLTNQAVPGQGLAQRNTGPAKNVGGGAAFDAPPGQTNYTMGALNFTDWAGSGRNLSDGTFSSENGEGYLQWDKLPNPTTTPNFPGMVAKDPDLYNVIIPSDSGAGQNTVNNTGRRVHYNTNATTPGNLNKLIVKLMGTGLGRLPSLYGGVIALGDSDEKSASIWLSQGYGLLRGGEPNQAFISV